MGEGVTKATVRSDMEAESTGPGQAAVPSARQRAVHRQEPNLQRPRADGPTPPKARPEGWAERGWRDGRRVTNSSRSARDFPGFKCPRRPLVLGTPSIGRLSGRVLSTETDGQRSESVDFSIHPVRGGATRASSKRGCEVMSAKAPPICTRQ